MVSNKLCWISILLIMWCMFGFAAESNKEISVRLGVMWKNLSADTKEGYYTASRQADEEHKRKYPGYYYSPKEARMNKMHKHNLALARKGNKPVDALHLVKVSDRCYSMSILNGVNVKGKPGKVKN
jgi:HMG (high mobility group) box.